MLKLGIDPEKLLWATFICQYSNMALVSFRHFRKNLGNLRVFFFGKWFTAPPGEKFPVRLCLERSHFLHIWTKLKEVGDGRAFKMVVGLLSPQLSRFFHTGTVFDLPALPNNCHQHHITHYCFFFCINISSANDVNASLGNRLYHRLTARPKFISFFFST